MNRTSIRHAARSLAAALIVALAPSAAQAQAYPSKPVRFIVPFPPGGITDVLMRIMAEGMAVKLGQPVVIDNRAGASGLIGVDAIIKSPADGYTIGMLPSPTVIAGLLQGREWNVENDMSSIGLNYRQGILLAINPNAPLLKDVRNAGDLVRVIRANPGKVNYGTIGVGSTGHLLGELMRANNGLQWEHVPYKGTAPLMQDLLAAQNPIVFMGASTNDVDRNPGRLLLIATSGPRRQAGVLPLAETGFPGIDATTWGGVIAPAKLPPAVQARLVADYKATFDAPEVREKAQKILDQEYMGPAELTQLTRQTIATWGKVIKDNNIKP